MSSRVRSHSVCVTEERSRLQFVLITSLAVASKRTDNRHTRSEYSGYFSQHHLFEFVVRPVVVVAREFVSNLFDHAL